MFEIRIHGRGGQGVVTAAEVLAIAAFEQGQFAQAFPSFGSERSGAPIASFCRISDAPIRTHEPVVAPDCVIVQDPSLLTQADVLAGVRPDGYLIVNTTQQLPDLAVAIAHVQAVPAGEIARRYVGKPLPNAALLGAFAALTGVVSIHAVSTAIRDRLPHAVAGKNIAAAHTAFAVVRQTLQEGETNARAS